MARPDSDPEREKEEARCIQAIRALLKTSLTQEEEAKIDDAMLRRFLRARSLNIEKAHKFLLQHLKWRREFVPDGSINPADVRNEAKQEKLCIQGFDRVGRPIGVIIANRHIAADRDLEELKRYAVYGFDKGLACLTGEHEKFVIIADMKGWTYKNMDLRGYLALLEILQDHYPERLAKYFLLHVPYLFWGMWKIIYPFIDPVVREKFIFVEDKHMTETLLKEIDISQLPDIYGGEMPLKPVK